MTHSADNRPVRVKPSAAALTYLAVFVLLLFLLPDTVQFPGPLRSNGSPAVLLSLIALGLVFMNFLVRRDRRFFVSGPGLMLTIGSLEIVSWASGELHNYDAIVRAASLRGLLGVFGYVGIALLTMLGVRTARHRQILLIFIIIGLIFDGVIGILQNLAHINERFLLMPPGFILNHAYDQAERFGQARATGTAESPIEFAALMAVLVALTIPLLCNASGRNIRILAALGLAVGLVGIPASVSRTAVVALGAVGLAFLLTSRLRAWASAVLSLAAAVVILAFLVPSEFHHITGLFSNVSSNDSITGRTSDYPVVFENFAKRPIFGSGLGSTIPGQYRYLDNQWLQAAVEGGAVGLAAFALMIATAFGGCAVAWKFALNNPNRLEVAGYLGAVAALFSSSFTFDLYAFNQAKFTFFLIVGLAWSSASQFIATSRNVTSGGAGRRILEGA